MWNTCREVFFFSACFSRGIRDDIEEEDDQVSSYAVFLSSFFLFVFLSSFPKCVTTRYKQNSSVMHSTRTIQQEALVVTLLSPPFQVFHQKRKEKNIRRQFLSFFFYHLRRFFCQIEFQLPVLQIFQYLRVSSNLRLTESTNMEHH